MPSVTVFPGMPLQQGGGVLRLGYHHYLTTIAASRNPPASKQAWLQHHSAYLEGVL